MIIKGSKQIKGFKRTGVEIYTPKKKFITSNNSNSITDIISDAAVSLQIWYDASDITQFNPTNPADEADITQWKDKSNYGRNANPIGGATTRPTFENSILQNGKSYLEFDGEDSLSVNPYSDLASATNFTAFIVAKSLDLDPSNCLLSTNEGDIRLVISNTSVAIGMNGANNFGTATVADDNVGSDAGDWHIYSVIYDGSQATNAGRLLGRRDKSNLTFTFTGTIPATFSASNNTLYIGQRADGTGKIIGYIAEVILFNKTLSLSEYTGIEDYLSAKWGL